MRLLRSFLGRAFSSCSKVGYGVMKAPSDESESWPRMGLSPTEIWLVWFQMMVYFGGMCVCVSSPENAMVISSLAKTSSCLLAVVLKCAGPNCSDLRLATQHKNIHPMPICWPLYSLVSHHPLPSSLLFSGDMTTPRSLLGCPHSREVYDMF